MNLMNPLRIQIMNPSNPDWRWTAAAAAQAEADAAARGFNTTFNRTGVRFDGELSRTDLNHVPDFVRHWRQVRWIHKKTS